MANDAVELVRIRTDFYRDNYRRVISLLLLAVITIVALAIGLVYLVTHPPAPKYFATDSQGRLIQILPLDEPNLTTASVLQWVNIAVISVFTYDFVNYRQQLQAASQFFTPDGWQDFLGAIKSTQTLNDVIAKKLVVSAVATGAPVVLQEGNLQLGFEKRYAWRIRMPMLITYQNAAQVTQQNVVATILVVRVSTLDTPKGIGIAQLVVSSTGEINSV